MAYDQSKIAFVDTETGGLDPERHPIWEIAVIVDGVEHCWQQRLPDDLFGGPDLRGITRWVRDNTGFDERYDHEGAVSRSDSIDYFRSLVAGRHLVGACPWFDSERLHRAQLAASPLLRDLGWHYHLIDVENLAVGYMAGCDVYHHTPDFAMSGLLELPWKSDDLSLALGVNPADFEPKHSALADARWVKAIYEKIMGAPRAS